MRSTAGLSQEDLAERSGVSRNGISDLERGLSHTPRFETVRLLADGLALTDEERAALVAAARPEVWEEDPAGRRPPPLHSLPAPLTRLIGRETELATLQAMLQDEQVRLLTLTGPGGVGKTRLAIEVARQLSETFPDGVSFVDLTPLTDPALVVPTVAAVLGVREAAGRPLIETMAVFLTPKRLLLVLDNCERVLAAAPDLIRLLAASPGLTLLATSRATFHVRGEHEVPVLPLPLPSETHPRMLHPFVQAPAVALFLERATGSDPDFALTEENASAIVDVCRRVDGFPLAIELAAARVKALPPALLLNRLERRLSVLTRGGPDLPPRQRTMRDAVAWSYDLLDPAEQALFRGIASFTGGFTLEAAEAVTGQQGDLEIVDGIASLVERNLLRCLPGASGAPRYHMFETIREYASEQLTACGEAGTIGARHAAYYLGLVAQAASHLWGHDQIVWLDRLEAEHDNLRTTLGWSQDQPKGPETVGRSALTLAWFWYLHGHMTEGRLWLEGLLDAADEDCMLSPSARARTLVGAGFLAYGKGDLTQAAGRLEQGVALARAVGEHATVVRALMFLGFTVRDQGHYARAMALFEESLALARVMDDSWGIGYSLFLLSTAAYFLGDEEQEASFAAASLPILRQQGERLSLAYALLAVGRVCSRQGDLHRANILTEECLTLSRALGNRRGIGYALCELGTIARHLGDHAHAATHAVASLTPWQQLGNIAGIADGLEELAMIATAQGDAARGARFAGAAAAMREDGDMPLAPRFHAALEQNLAPARRALGEAGFAVAWAAGREASLDQVITEAQKFAGQPLTPAGIDTATP